MGLPTLDLDLKGVGAGHNTPRAILNRAERRRKNMQTKDRIHVLQNAFFNH